MMDRILQVVIAFMAAAAAAAAQSSDTSSIILAPKTEASAPAPAAVPGDSSRPASAGIAAEITSGMPTYSPAASASGPGTLPGDLRDFDKPRNQIPRLPVEMMQRYVVREARVPVFRPMDLYTRATLIDMSFKEHPGLLIGNLFGLNAAAAYDRMVKEQLYADRLDLVDTTIAMAVDGDRSEAEAMQQAILDEAFLSAGQEGPVGIKRENN